MVNRLKGKGVREAEGKVREGKAQKIMIEGERSEREKGEGEIE